MNKNVTVYKPNKEDTSYLPQDVDKYMRIVWLKDMYSRYEDYWEGEINRYVRNSKMMWGVNYGQWPSYVVEKLRTQGRRPPTFNIISKKIQTQIGTFMSNDFDIKFTPSNGKVDTLAGVINDMYYSDKLNMHWKVSERVALRDCFTSVGYERMGISDQNSEYGNITYEPMSPTHVYLDPGWKSYFVKDIRSYFEWGMFNVQELMDMFPDKASELKELRQREEMEGENLGEFTGGTNDWHWRDTGEKWGARHKLITFHHTEKQDRMWEYDLINRCNFPETGFKPQSDEDIAAKKEYIQMVGIDPNHDVTIRKQIKRVKYVESISPTINKEMFFCSGKDRIQTNNCNIYPIGDSLNGQFKSTVDDLYDVQISYNRGRMNIEDIQMRSAKGAFIIDEAVAGGDANKRREIEAQWNNPAARIWADEGSTVDLGPHGGIIPLPNASPTNDMFRQSAELWDLADGLSMVPAAMDARTESSSESGKLFQSKVQVGLISQKYAMEIYESHKREKAAAYVLQAKLVYAGWPRTFHKAGEDSSFVINKRVQDSYGTRFVMDDISKLPVMLITLTPSKGGQNLRTELRSQYAESLNLLSDPADRLARLTVLNALYKTYELPEEERKQIELSFNMLLQNQALLETKTHLELQGMIKQTMGQMKQVQGGDQQPPMSEEAPEQQISDQEMSPQEANAGTMQEDTIPEDVNFNQGDQ